MTNKSNATFEEDSLTFPYPPGISNEMKFSTYITFDILSIVCTLFVLYYLLFDRTLRHALNNHIIIVLLLLGLFYEFISMPLTLFCLRYGHLWIQSSIFYLFSFFIDYGSYSAQIMLFTWATIERHILIFHDRWVSTLKKRFFVHYLPIVAILLYCLVYFSLIIFAPFCPNSFQSFVSSGVFIPCLYIQTILGAWDLFVHQVICTLLIVIFSLSLIIRVIWQKWKRNQVIQWRRHRKMTVQLISISALYMLFNLPWTILILVTYCGLPDRYTIIPILYAEYFRLYIIFFFPFVCCGSLSELRGKLTKLLCCQRRNQIVPMVRQQTLAIKPIVP